MKLFSPAKINLYLQVHFKRKDDFHNLTTIMQPINFGDFIEVSFNDSKQITITSNNPLVPTDYSNIVWKALDLFFKKTNLKLKGISIDLDKRIPIGSGLGGGSSNAVTVLKALNKHYNYILNNNELISIAKILGSDTVFFCHNQTALCKKKGEVIDQFIPSKKWTYLLICPDISCLTKEIFSKNNLILTNSPQDLSLFKQKINNGSALELEQIIYNSLKHTVCEVYPQIKELIKRIEEKTSKRVFISGSGSTLFMIFEDNDQASQCKKFLEIKLHSKVKFFTSQTYIVV